MLFIWIWLSMVLTEIQASNMYCGDRDCYDLLQVNSRASTGEIRRQYRRLSILSHPDKQPGAEAQFRAITNAYEILRSPLKRQAYDHYIEHPEDYAYNYGMYYRHVYAPPTDLRLVVLGFILTLSLFQHLSQKQKYAQAQQYFRQSDTIRRKALQIQEQRRQNDKRKGRTSMKDKKKQKLADKEELEQIVKDLMDNVVIQGGYGKPEWKSLLCFRLLFLPYTLAQYAQWQWSWFVRHTLQNLPYNDDERLYLTCKALSVTQECFFSEGFDAITREKLLHQELWIEANMKTYEKQQLEELKLKYPNKYKQMIRRTRGQFNPDFHDSDSEDDDLIDE